MKFSIHTILVGNFLSVDEFIDNKNTDGFTDGKNVQKKIVHFNPSVFSLGIVRYKRKYHMQLFQ
jgi:hypothetical protein